MPFLLLPFLALLHSQEGLQGGEKRANFLQGRVAAMRSSPSLQRRLTETSVAPALFEQWWWLLYQPCSQSPIANHGRSRRGVYAASGAQIMQLMALLIKMPGIASLPFWKSWENWKSLHLPSTMRYLGTLYLYRLLLACSPISHSSNP